ncbi:MAG: hypothetical protein Q7R92_01260 [bacterium]|nr:hypothetical protein [bacterium]
MNKIKSFFNYLRLAVLNHKLALVGAILVGLIYILPNIFFIASLGKNYHGIPMMQTANEDFYLARIQKVIDGHSLLGPAVFYENRHQGSLTPAGGEIFYALPSRLLRLSPVNLVIASRFVLPFILFFLVYFLISRLTANSFSALNKINAIAGALLVTLGYDLVDYRSTWLFLTGKISGGNFLIWARLVNPVMGAFFLFSFLLCLWVIIRQERYRKTLIAAAGGFLALAIYTYFFSWGIAVSVLAILGLVYLLEKRYGLIKSLAAIGLVAAVLSSPYWFFSWQLSRAQGYKEALLRNGLFYTHYPLGNKILLAALAFYAIATIFLFIKRKTLPLWKERIMDGGLKNRPQDWYIFSLALLLGGLWALNQQIITGRTIYPYHFVQYTIPLAMIAAMVLFYNLLTVKRTVIWRLALFFIIMVSLGWGIFTQVKAYRVSFDYFAGLQVYGPLFDWLNLQPKDNVVFVNNSDFLNGLVPAFTHSNVYSSTFAYNLIDPNRRHDSYLARIRLKGVTAEEFDEYLKQNRHEAVGYLFSNWKVLYGIKQFPDFSDPLFEEKIKKLPEDYRKFYAKDFRQALSKYRLDYILSVGPLSDKVQADLGGVTEVFRSGDILIYNFK